MFRSMVPSAQDITDSTNKGAVNSVGLPNSAQISMLGYDVLSATKEEGSHSALDSSKVCFTRSLLSQGDPDHTDSQADLYIYVYTLQSEIVFAWAKAILGNQNNHGRPLGLSGESKSKRGLYRHVCRTLSLLWLPHAPS